MLTIEQQEQRKHGLGATDCAAVMGLSPYRTPYELWLIKTGRQTEDAILTEDRLRLRHAHEETISQEYMARQNCKLKRVNQTVYHKRIPYMLCNLDRVVIGRRKIVECKTASGFLRYQWGENGTDEAPIHYILQVQHQLACSEYEDADLAALIDIDDYRIYPMPRNEKAIEKIEEACTRFWEENVIKDIAPPPRTRNDLKLMYPRNNGKFKDATANVIDCITSLNSCKLKIAEHVEYKEEREKELIAFIGENDGIIDGDRVLLTYKANKNGVRSLRTIERA